MMKNKLLLLFLLLVAMSCSNDDKQQTQSHYLQNKAPLMAKPYLELPLGSIKAKGWLQEQLLAMKSGLTGHLDETYAEVVGKRNAWLGGDGDAWERGPYWIDGLLPLAYILDDTTLKAKVQPWIEWTLKNQRDDGYIGPLPTETELAFEPGLQRDKQEDWWPKMVMLKVLQQYYNATHDERVITALTRYFKYQLQQLPQTPLDHWTFWGNQRGGDNLMVVYWLYNITGDEFLLKLAELIKEQTFPWTDIFLHQENHAQASSPWHFGGMKRYPFDYVEIASLTVSQVGGIHGVNLSQGLKLPVVYYQQHPDEKYLFSVRKALADIQKYHGQPQGMFSGDEGLHGNNPVQGIEFCSIAETMFSLETMLTITGDMTFANQLERITYNALPTQASDDFTSRQYFQSANQVEVSDKHYLSFESANHHRTDFVYGLLTGYSCCTANMHQSWPKFVQNLWYATADGGVAALLYAPSSVTLKVGDNITATIEETTGFPFRETVEFSMKLDHSGTFPFHLRIPAWTNGATIFINSEAWNGDTHGKVAIIDRVWNDGDKVQIRMPMHLEVTQWYDFTKSIERGPLVYALRIEEESKKKNRQDQYGTFEEIYPKSKWNYALVSEDVNKLQDAFRVEELAWDGTYPWNLTNLPIRIKARGAELTSWQTMDGAPVLPAWWNTSVDPEAVDSITLVPYGATTLRITEFPVVNIRH